MPTIQYTDNPSISPSQLAELFKASGIRRPVEDLPRLQQMLAHANLICAAYCGAELVGIARALTDFSYCCYLSDLAVATAFQKQGIGRELVDRVRKRTGPRCNLILLSAPGAMDYYPKLGFSQITNGWIFNREE